MWAYRLFCVFAWTTAGLAACLVAWMRWLEIPPPIPPPPGNTLHSHLVVIIFGVGSVRQLLNARHASNARLIQLQCVPLPLLRLLACFGGIRHLWLGKRKIHIQNQLDEASRICWNVFLILNQSPGCFQILLLKMRRWIRSKSSSFWSVGSWWRIYWLYIM